MGQNIGAKKTKRAEKITKISITVSFIMLTIIGIITFLLANKLSTLFIPNDKTAIQASALFIKIIALSFGFIGIQMSLSGLFRGSGNTLDSMFLSLFSLWILKIPLAYFLSQYLFSSEIGIWLAFPLTNIIVAMVGLFWFKRGGWKNKKLTKEINFSKRILEETLIEDIK